MDSAPHLAPPGILTIAVLTFQRPGPLAALLKALPAQFAHPGVSGLRCEVVVVDNDPQGSARAQVDETSRAWRDSGHESPLRYAHEPRPGIAAARNRALDEAADSATLAFIDDDEVPAPGWLSHLVEHQVATGAAAVTGPVVPRYPAGVAAWIEQGPFHSTVERPTGSRMTHAATGNLLLDLDVVRRHGLRFDASGTRGGEDSRFTSEIVRVGGVISWCAEAVVTETVPPARTSPRWVATRSMSEGNIWGDHVLTQDGRRLDARLRVGVLGAARLGAGCARAAAGWATRSPQAAGDGVHTAARGVGMAAASLGFIHDGYARPGQSAWTRVGRDTAERPTP